MFDVYTFTPVYVQKDKSTIFKNTLTDRARAYSLPRRSKKMVKYHLKTAWSPATTTDDKRQFTENRHIPTDYKTRGQFNKTLTIVLAVLYK